MKKNSVSPVWWWIIWITLTIVTFFVSCAFWTSFIANNVGSMDKPGVPMLWVTAVFGSWMVLLVPLIVVMYSKVDKTYEDARMKRELQDMEKARKKNNYKTLFVDAADRLLEKNLAQKLKAVPKAIRNGHLVTAILRDGRRVENVFVRNRNEVAGVYGIDRLTFAIKDIVDVEPTDLDHLPAFTPQNWLRLDEDSGL